MNTNIHRFKESFCDLKKINSHGSTRIYTDLKEILFDLTTIKRYGDGKGISVYQCKSVANKNLCVLCVFCFSVFSVVYFFLGGVRCFSG